MILGASTNKLIPCSQTYLQTLLRELEFKKPQLDELVNTAESLKTDANKLQLQSKGEFTAVF
jgi:hypothetical protein